MYKRQTYYVIIRSRRRFVLDLHGYACFSIPRLGTALPSATRPPAAARPYHTRPTRHKVSSATVRPPNSTSGEHRKELSAVPDMAGGYKNMGKHGNPNTMQQDNLRMNDSRTAAVRPAAVLYMVGLFAWFGCCTCCFCCSTGVHSNAELDMRGASKGPVPVGHRKNTTTIQHLCVNVITCLLYTSPSPRD